MLLQSETLYVYTAVIHDQMDKSNATYVTIWTINTILYYTIPYKRQKLKVIEVTGGLQSV